jgi:hypothetical protein
MLYRNTRVFALLIGLAAAVVITAAIASRASAATLEEDYIVTRDAAVARLTAASEKNADRAAKEEKAALAGLEKKMRAIIGLLQIQGMKTEGTLNTDTLINDGLGFGMLDGLKFAAADGRTEVVVTTDGLLQRWLKGHRDWWGDHDKMPPTLHEAASINAFYTQAISTDAAVVKYVVVPIEAPAGATFVYAMLASRTQDEAPNGADEAFLVLARAGKVFVVSGTLKTPIGPIPACEAIRHDFDKKAEDALAAYRAGGMKDEALSKRSSDLNEQGEKAFLSCFAERAAQEPSFAAAKKEVQDLLDLLSH